MLQFSDGMKFDTGGPMRASLRSDGWYAVGRGQLIPCASAEAAGVYVEEDRRQHPEDHR